MIATRTAEAWLRADNKVLGSQSCAGDLRITLNGSHCTTDWSSGTREAQVRNSDEITERS